MSRPTLTPEIYERFRRYRENDHWGWGSLHIVLEDQNLADKHVRSCIEGAEANGDEEGAALARLLLTLTKTQRGRIGDLA